MLEENGTLQISVDKIVPNRFQPRLSFNEKDLNELADSIKEHGIIEPLVLRSIGDKYEIIAGERRYKAARMLGLKTVPAVIKVVDNTKSAELAVVENIQRKDLSPVEEANSYKKLMDDGMTQEEIAQKIGVSQPTIANKIRLLSLPGSVQNALLESKISERHARSLLTLQDSALQESFLNKIISNRWTVRQTEDEISKVTGKKSESAPKYVDTLPDLLKSEDEQKVDLSETEIPILPSLEEFKRELFKDSNEKSEDDLFNISNDKLKPTEEFLDFDIIDNPDNNEKVIEEIKSKVEELKNKGNNINVEVHDFEDRYNIVINLIK